MNTYRMESYDKIDISRKVRTTPPGILRLDFSKSKCLSAEFKFNQGEPTSPQPSIDRSSVTFADDSVRSDSSTKINYFNPLSGRMMDAISSNPPNTDGEDSDLEDYSASANAIIQRRASVRKSKKRSRRASSPFTPDVLPGNENGRRSSVFTTSSGDTAITMDENIAAEATQEEILENIKLHKEVLSNVRMQPWNMRKKLKLVVQAKAYIKKHEGVLQERLAKSHSTRDMLARWNILLIKKWQKFRREMLNLSKWFLPWELKIKEIESHFGSVVASYFTFLRWLFWVNIVISVALISFVTIPELLIANPEKAKDRKYVLEDEKYNATDFMTLWKFDGALKYTPLFYGWYSNSSSGGYKIPLAYFMTGLVVYGYSFFATLKKMAENSRTSKLSEKDDECIFTWKVFTAWDYMIGNAETAHNRVASIIMGFKEALLEEAEKKKDTRNWRVICIRVLVNIVVIGLLAISMYAVVLVVKRSTEPEADSTFWRKNEIAIVMSLITFVFPMFFEVLGIFEQYHPRKQLRLQLGRIMVLNLVNLYSLIFALIDKIGDMTTELQVFKNITNIINDTLYMSTTPSSDSIPATSCYTVCNDISKQLPSRHLISELTMHDLSPQLSELVTNITTIMMTNITTTFNESVLDIFILNQTLTNFVNTTLQDKIINNINDTIEDIHVPNMNFTDLEYQFADYLTYLLFSLTNETNLTENITYIYENLTTIFDNITEVYGSTTTTSTTTDIGRFDYDFSTVFNYLSSSTFQDETSTYIDYYTSTISNLPENVTTETANCREICETTNIIHGDNLENELNYTMKARFRNLCWETMFGQELISLTVMDLIMTIVPALGMDFFRGLFVRVMNRCWCWDLEKKFPKYGDFKVAENILSLVNNQGMVWMGMFFCPGLVVFNVVKLYITMYFKAWAVMTCNVPPEVIFRASRSNNFYYYLLLMMLFLCVLPVGYTIVWIEPSWHCGPFSKYQRIFYIFTKTLKENVPEVLHKVLDYIASPGIVIPLLVLLILIIYYLLSLTNSLREANEELKIQLRRERTEERRKMFQLAEKRRRGGSGESNELSNAPFNKWKKLLGNLPSGKSLDETPKQEGDDAQNKDDKLENKGKDFFSKLIKKALRKSSTSDDEHAEDGTDTEQHDSLPYDTLTAAKSSREIRSSFSWGAVDLQNVARKALQIKRTKPEIQYTKTPEPKHVHIDERNIISRQNSDINRNLPMEEILEMTINDNEVLKRSATTDRENFMRSVPSTSKSKEVPKHQDSESSLWSEGSIPVITISKTESTERINIYQEQEPESSIIDEEPICSTKPNVFKPKIKCVLKKQTTEIDEDTIRYFNDDVEKNISIANSIKSLAEENLDSLSEGGLSLDNTIGDISSSDNEQKEGSTITILKSPDDN